MTVAVVYPAGLDSFYDAATLALHNDEGGPSTRAPAGTTNIPETRAQYDERIGLILQAIETNVGWVGDANPISHESRITAVEAAVAGGGGGGGGMSPTLMNVQSVLGAVLSHTPVAITIPEQTVLGRVTGGNITALTSTQLKSILGLGEIDVAALSTDLSTINSNVGTLSSSVGTLTTSVSGKVDKSANLSDLASRDTSVTNLLGTPLDISALPLGMKPSDAVSSSLVAIQDGFPVAISSSQLYASGISTGPVLNNGGSFSVLSSATGILFSVTDASTAPQPHMVIGTFLGGAFLAMGDGTTFPNANITWASANTLKVSNALTIAGLPGAAAVGGRWAGTTTTGAPTTGTFATGDWVINKSGTLEICTAPGTPGTWVGTVGDTSPTFLNSWLVWDGTAAHGGVGATQTVFGGGPSGWSWIGVLNASTDALPSAGAQQIGGAPSLGMGPGGSSGFDITFTRINSTNFSVTGAPTFINTINVGNTANAVNIAIGNVATGTKIGTSSSSLMGFWNATPVAQIAGSTDVLAGLVTIGLRAASSNPSLNLGTGSVTTGGMTFSDASAVVTLDTGTTNGVQFGTSAFAKIAFYGNTPIVKQGATVDLGTVLNNLGLRSAGTTYPITTSGAVTLSGTTSIASPTISGHAVIEGVTATGATGTGKFVFDAAPTITGHPTIEGVTSTGATGTGKFVFSISPTLSGTVTFDDTSAIVVLSLGTTNGVQIGSGAFEKLAFYGNTPIAKQAANVDLGTVLNNLGLRSAGTTYPITTSGAVAMSGTVATGALTTTGAHTVSTTLTVTGNIGFNGKAAQATTGWAAPTGTALRTAAPNATYSTTGATGIATGGFDSSTHRDNVITDLANTMQRLAGLITDLRANGVIG